MLAFFWHALGTKLSLECLGDSLSTFIRETIWLTIDSIWIKLDAILSVGYLVFGVINLYWKEALRSLEPVLFDRLLEPNSLEQLCLLVRW